MTIQAYICDAVRTPIGRYAGSLSTIRTDDLAAQPIKALMARQPDLDWAAIDDVIFGCANQAGEDNRNVARMALLLAGLPVSVSGATVNRLCGSGLEAIALAARTIRAGEADLMLAGGVESMSRAPFVMGKPDTPFARSPEMHDTTLGWRFINPEMKRMYGVDSMAQTAENLADEYKISREEQDRFALGSQMKAKAAMDACRFGDEIAPVSIPQRKGDPIVVAKDEHPRADTTLEALAKLKPITRDNGTITAGNSSGINDGAACLLIASEAGAKRHGLKPLARIVAAASAGVPPRVMGIGPVPASRKALERAGLALDQMDIIEINEAFAAQVIAVARDLNLSPEDPRLNPNGGAIALGHPLGMSGARIASASVHELRRTNKRYALCAMCIGVGQGVAAILEGV